ncbi:MAG: DUF3307 domain-containing protein [Actinobacteria bacterium]|nr:DUF3307 domain-containing protein [Actinomycetota bacterium]
MPLFLSLFLGHILGDFVLQPGRLVVAKRRRLQAVLLHTAIVTLCCAAAMASELRQAWLPVLLAGVAHFGVEELTIRARRSPESSNVTVFLLDQGLHVVSMIVIASGGLQVTPVIGLWAVSLSTLATVCGVATVAFAGSILIFEIQAAGQNPEHGAEQILRFDAARLYGFAERGGALMAALLAPFPALGAVLFAPRVAYALLSPKAHRREELIAASVGIALCAVAWVLVARVGP